MSTAVLHQDPVWFFQPLQIIATLGAAVNFGMSISISWRW